MTTSELKSIELTNSGNTSTSVGLDHIATASLLEEKFNGSSDAEDESEEEVFEDGDANDDEVEADENDNDDHEQHDDDGRGSEKRHESVAAVLTELSQVNAPVTNNMISSSVTNTNTTVPPIFPLPSRPLPNPNMAATISSINAYLQSQLLSGPSAQPQKARLYGPIRANVNIRHGVWAPRLRCRKRKNLHAKDGIWINPTCTLDHLVYLVKSVLPDEFEWDPQASPLRYQAVNDQSLQSLKTVSGTVASGQSLFSAFDLVRNRRSDGDNFILQLYVYGTWTVLLKPHVYQSTGGIGSNTAGDDDMMNSISLPPPPKKKYQQAHYNQQQMQMNMMTSEDSSIGGQNSGMFHMRLSPPNTTSSTTSSSTISSASTASNQSTPYYTHPLSANAPVTFLPTVTLEMKMNGIFVPVEISRRSFVSAIRACSIPKPPVNHNTDTSGANVSGSSSGTCTSSSGTPPPNIINNNSSSNSNSSNNNANITPPPSDA